MPPARLGGRCPVYVHLAALRCIDLRRDDDDSPQLRHRYHVWINSYRDNSRAVEVISLAHFGAHGTRLHAVTITNGNNFNSRPRLQCSRIAN